MSSMARWQLHHEANRGLSLPEVLVAVGPSLLKEIRQETCALAILAQTCLSTGMSACIKGAESYDTYDGQRLLQIWKLHSG